LISAEGDDNELQTGLDHILRFQGLGYDQGSGLPPRSLAGEDSLMTVEPRRQTERFQAQDRLAAEAAPKLVFIDSFADVSPANEINLAKVRPVSAILRGVPSIGTGSYGTTA